MSAEAATEAMVALMFSVYVIAGLLSAEVAAALAIPASVTVAVGLAVGAGRRR